MSSYYQVWTWKNSLGGGNKRIRFLRYLVEADDSYGDVISDIESAFKMQGDYTVTHLPKDEEESFWTTAYVILKYPMDLV